MKRLLGILLLALVLAPKPAGALIGTDISIFGFNYHIGFKSFNTDPNGNPDGTCTWVLTGTGGGMDFIEVHGPVFP